MSDGDKSKGLPVVDVSSNHKEIIVTEKTVLADRRTKTFHFDKVFGQNSKQVFIQHFFKTNMPLFEDKKRIIIVQLSMHNLLCFSRFQNLFI
jgi:hypothetical protein